MGKSGNKTVTEEKATTATSGKKGDASGKKDAGGDVNETVSLTSLFRYAGAGDLLLIFFGTVGAVGSGAMRPISSILFGARGTFVVPMIMRCGSLRSIAQLAPHGLCS